MNVFRELARALKDTPRLQPRYYVLTSVIGLAGVGLGIGAMLLASDLLAASLGIAPNAPLGTQAHGTAWLVIFLALIPVSAYVGVVAVAGSFATLMVLLGRITTDEALRYTFLSRYPRYWLKS